MYHGVSNLVKPFFGHTRIGRVVDKPRPLAYSVPPCEERDSSNVSAQAAGPVSSRRLLSPFQSDLGTLCFIMLTRGASTGRTPRFKGVGLWAVLKVFAHLLPSFLVLTLPIAGIIASITAFGRLSLDKGTRRDAGGRLEPLAAGPSGHAVRPPGLRADDVAGSMGCSPGVRSISRRWLSISSATSSLLALERDPSRNRSRK